MKTPTVLQMEAVECGAAALAMVLAHHGKYVPLATLRTECGVSRDGSTASSIVRAARTHGMVAKGYKRDPADLRRMEVPVIIHWNFNHFLVFEGFRGEQAYLNDPAHGPRVVDAETFDASFTGVVLTFATGDAFVPGGRAPSLWASLRSRLDGAGWGLLYVVLAGLALVGPGVLLPAFSRTFIDGILSQEMHAWHRPLLLLMAATAAGMGGLFWLRQQHLLRLEMKLAVRTAGTFLWHVLRLPVNFFTQRSSGDVGARVAISDRVAYLLSGPLATNALNVGVVLLYGGLMLAYDPVLTAVAVGTAGLNALALQVVSRRRTDINRRLLQARGELVGIAMGGLQTIETLKASGAEGDFFRRWSGTHARVVAAEQEMGLYTQALLAVPPLLTGAATALVLGVGGLRVMDGVLSIGLLVGFQVLMSSFITPITQMVQLGSMLQEVKGDVDRLDDVMDHRAADLSEVTSNEPGGADSTTDSRALPSGLSTAFSGDGDRGTAEADVVPTDALALRGPVTLDGHLTLENVTFGYNPLSDPFLENISLEVPPGRRVALVGGSGSGKSTLVRLVCGLLQPWYGTVGIDGRPWHTLRPSQRAATFSAVDQRVFLFEGTVRDNLTLWDRTIPDRDVVRATRDACIHTDVMARTGGLDAPVEEGGRNFSGGQRQRLEIARALARTPSLLVLDEATSALDPATEKRIDDRLRRRGCACLIVAHRLSTIRDCDEIVVLDEGRIDARGTHDTLLREGGLYAELVATM